jgi:hypothetical protein
MEGPPAKPSIREPLEALRRLPLLQQLTVKDEAGVQSARDPKYTVGPQRRRMESDGHA